ncbi:hypothetical protein [Halomarina ordinaria]|uniref:Uncharacterized protein n=1 Tax=Halomarina ordinaria TaxID=3033939 RepID=A0ABD5U7A6_9EURY|nr:hypothetical protein [Halomarina sp. PSRA2]
MRTRLALALTALLVCAALVPPAAGAPPPRPVCPVCGALDGDGIGRSGAPDALGLTNHTATATVHENGTMTWRVRAVLDDEATRRFEGNASGLADLVAGEFAARRNQPLDHPGPASEHELLGSTLDGRTLTVSLRTTNAARQVTGDLVLVEYFDTDGTYQSHYYASVDRLTLVGPEGTVVTNDPAMGRVEGDRLVVTGEVHATQVVFGQRGPASALATLFVQLRGVGDTLADNALAYGGPLTAALGAALVGLAWGVRRRGTPRSSTACRRRPARSRVLAGVLGWVAVGVGAALVGHAVAFVLASAALVTLVAGVVYGAAAVRGERGRLALAGGALWAAALVALGVLFDAGGDLGQYAWVGLGVAAVALVAVWAALALVGGALACVPQDSKRLTGRQFE